MLVSEILIRGDPQNEGGDQLPVLKQVSAMLPFSEEIWGKCVNRNTKEVNFLDFRHLHLKGKASRTTKTGLNFTSLPSPITVL